MLCSYLPFIYINISLIYYPVGIKCNNKAQSDILLLYCALLLHSFTSANAEKLWKKMENKLNLLNIRAKNMGNIIFYKKTDPWVCLLQSTVNPGSHVINFGEMAER